MTTIDSTPDPFEQGLDAAARGDSNLDNPYPEGSEEHNDWLAGLVEGESA